MFCAKFDPEDKYIACGYGDGAIRIFNLDSGKLAFNLTSGIASEEMPVTGVKWRPISS